MFSSTFIVLPTSCYCITDNEHQNLKLSLWIQTLQISLADVTIGHSLADTTAQWKLLRVKLSSIEIDQNRFLVIFFSFFLWLVWVLLGSNITHFCWASPTFTVSLIKKSLKNSILVTLQWWQSYASCKFPGVSTKICWNMWAFMKTHYLSNNRQSMCSNLTRCSCHWVLPSNSSQAPLKSRPTVFPTSFS